MALTNEELQDIISNLSPEERKQLLSQLGRQVEVDNIANPTQSTNTKPKVKPKSDNSKVYCCPLCGSASYKKHGTTSSGMQRYICKDCGKTFSENYGDSLRYTHLSESQWLNILRGIVNNHSLPQISRDCDISQSTAWACKMKINQAIMTMYGYTDLFQGTTQADEYYCRAAFKGKRDPEFFIYTLRRMPRHNRNYSEKVEYLQNAGLYEKLQREEPEYLQELLFEEPKMKRGISNEQICILTLVDENNKLYFKNNAGLLKEMVLGSQKKMVGLNTIDKNHQQVCIVTAVDRNNNMYIEPITAGTAESSDIYCKLHSRVSHEAILITDDHHSYKLLTRKDHIEHIRISGGTYISGAYNLARVNSLHSSMDRFFGTRNITSPKKKSTI